MKTLIIVQARLGSKRLPKKVLKPILGKPLLFYCLTRLKAMQTKARLIVATTTLPQDDLIDNFCKSLGLQTFRGDENNVLKRFYEAAKQANATTLIRITADCPLVDPSLIDQMLSQFEASSSYQYFSNTINRTFPKGFDVEIFPFESLHWAYQKASLAYDLEHVTPIMHHTSSPLKIGQYYIEESFSNINLSVDTIKDFNLVQQIIERLYPKNPLFTYQEVLEILPDLCLPAHELKT